MDVLGIKKNYLIVSRGATAIYLILKGNKLENKKVLLPANICYAAVFPVVFSGNHPVFCDVDNKSGNVTYQIVESMIKDVDIAILPHMFGNPIDEISEIKQLCQNNNVLLIEDCASSMGSYDKNGVICGTSGDYTIFSTGYSKTVDVGGGGIIISDRDLQSLKDLYYLLPDKLVSHEYNESFFSKFYRLIRNNPHQTISSEILVSSANVFRSLFIYKDLEIQSKVLQGLCQLDDICQLRKKKCKLYDQLIPDNPLINKYHYSISAVPWRYNLFVRDDHHRKLIDYLLLHEIPVSDWYPNVTPVFGLKKHFEGVDHIEERIINFPLLIEDEKIMHIAETIKSYWG